MATKDNRYTKLRNPDSDENIPEADAQRISEKRRSAYLVTGLTIAVIVIAISVAFLTATYIHMKQVKSCACSSSQAYHISGYDPEIRWRQTLATRDSLAYQSAAQSEESTLRTAIGHRYAIDEVEITEFSQGITTYGIASGAVFYATVTLHGETVPTPDELRATLAPRISDDETNSDLKYRIFDVNVLHSHLVDHMRARRDASAEKRIDSADQLAASSAGTTCQPLFTGPFCQYPLCSPKGPPPPIVPGQLGFGRTLNIQQNAVCNSQTTFYVDSHISQIAVILDSGEAAYPKMTITNPNGYIIPPSQIIVITNNSAQLILEIVAPKAGRWTATYSGDIYACQFIVLGKTDLTISQGFVSGLNALNSDSVSPFINTGVPTFFVAHAYGLPYPGVVNFLEIFENHNIIWASKAQIRYHCAYETYFGIIYCNVASNYYYKIYGIDENGYKFQRTDTLRCRGNATVPTTTPVPGTCLNGGTPLGNNMCFCPPLFNGPACQFWVCQNGGTPVPKGPGCFCAIGFDGNHCQNVICTNHTNRVFNTVYRTFTVIIGTRYTMTQDWQGVIAAAKNITAVFNNNHPGVIKNYILTSFVDQTSMSITYQNASAFLAALQSLHYGGFNNCSQAVLTAVAQTLPNVIPGSPIYIFTDALPSDAQMQTTIMHLNTQTQAQLNFILTDPTPIVGRCTWNTGTPGFQIYRYLSAGSQGSAIQVGKSQVLATFENAYLTTLHTLGTVLTNDFAQCSSQPPFTTFFVDSETTGLAIEATGSLGAAPRLVTTNPLGNQVVQTPAYAAGNMALYVLVPTVGVYTMTLTAGTANTGPCSYRVRALTSLQMFYGFSGSLRTDFNASQPFYNQPIHPVVHMNLFVAPLTQSRLSTQMMIYQTPGKPLYMSTGRLRARNCQYQLYYNSWSCQIPGQIFYMTVFGQDINGKTFQRSATGFCRGTAPPVHTCQNGGVLVNGICVCPAYWSGQYCTIAQCINGGTSTGAACKCPTGYNGTHCEITLCTSMNANVMNSANNRSLAFVIQATITESFDIQQIKQQINYTLSQISQQNATWFTRYILVTFTDTMATQLVVTSSQTLFWQRVNGITINSAVVQCPKIIATALISALRQTYQYGTVYVFTDSTFSDTNQFANVYNLLESTKAQVNFVVTNPSPCGANFTTPASTAFITFSTFSDGQALIVEKTAVSQLMRYIPLLYSNGLVFAGGALNCQTPQTFYIPIDAHTHSFTVTTAGYQPTTTIYLPNGQKYVAAPVVSNSQFIQILHIYKRQGTQPHPVVPGIWKVVVQTVPLVGTATGCSFQVRGQSNLNLFYGFVRNPHNDFPTKEPLSLPGYTDMMVGHMTNLPKSGSLEYMNMYLETSGALVGSSRFLRRTGCGYEFISQGFQCPASAFGILVAGYDEQNYLYNRIRVATCVSAGNPCLNGGVLYQSRCYCAPLWTGPTCATAICMNGGTNQGSKCTCPHWYTGAHCQYDMCTLLVPASFSPNNRSLTFVIDGTFSMSFIIQQMRANLQSVLTTITNQHPGWFTRFNLIIYYDPPNGQGIVGPVTSTSSLSTFMAAFNKFPIKTGGDCPNPAMNGLNAALNYVFPNSAVYLFTMGTAKDPGLQNAVITKASNMNAQINFVLGNENPCSSNGKTSGYQAYLHVVRATNGNIFLTPGSTIKFLNYISTQYSGNLIGQYSHPTNCISPITTYIPVDSHTTTMTFTFSGSSPNVVWKNPSGQIVSSYTTLLTNQFQLVGTINQPAPGIWTLTTNTNTGGCNIQVTAQSTLVAYFGYQSSIHSDIPYPTAIGGPNTNNYMLAHMTNLPSGGALEYVNFYTPSFSLGASARMMKRMSCSYDYYSQVFQCPSKQMGVLLSGTDEMGYLFQRQGVSECTGGPVTTSKPIYPTKSLSTTTTTMTTPTTTVFGPQCNLKSLTYDIIFVFDDSSGITFSMFNQIRIEMAAFASLYTISPTATQIAFVKFDYTGFVLSELNTLPSNVYVQGFINGIAYNGNAGQNINNALTQVQRSIMTVGNGYRPSANHMLILISSTTASPDPTAVAQQLRNAGIHILAIGYGPNANMAQLQQIAGANCAFAAPTGQQLHRAFLWAEAKSCTMQWC